MSVRTCLAVAVTSAALLTSCAAAQPPPASTALRNVEAITGTDVTGSNYSLTTGCYGTTRVFLRANSVAAVGNDPTCAISPIR